MKSTNWIKDRKRISFSNVKKKSPRNAKQPSKNSFKSQEKLKNRCKNLQKIEQKFTG